MEEYDKNQRKEIAYKLAKPLIGGLVSAGGTIASVVIMTNGFFKKDNGLFYEGMLSCWLFIYSSYLYNKEFNSIFNELVSRNKSSKLEQNLEE